MKPRGIVLALACACAAQLACACEQDVLLTRGEEQLRIAAALSRSLARSIETLPGVGSAEVHVALPLAPDYASALTPPPQASVLVRTTSPSARVDAAAIQGLVAGAVFRLVPSAVHIVVKPPAVGAVTAPPALAQLGPFAVARRSEPGLRALLASLLVVQMALALLLWHVVARARKRTGATNPPR